MTVISSQINDMVSANVPPEKINEWSQTKAKELIEAGVKPEKITEAFGVVPFDRKNEKKYWQSISSEIEKDIDFSKMESVDDIPKEVNALDRIQKFLLGDDERYQFKPYFEKAIGSSGVNKIIQYHSEGEWGYDWNLPEPEGTGFLEKLTEGAVGLVAELPTFVPGALVGGFTSGPGGAVFGGGFTAGAIQGMYTEALNRGQVKNFGEWWDIFVEEGLSEGAKTGAKLYAAYKLPGVLGKVPFVKPIVSNIVGKTITQSSAFTAVGALMGDDLPNAEDFAVTSLLFLPFNIRASQSKLNNVSAKTGKKPVDIIDNLIKDRTIWEDLNSKNIEVPRSYKDIAKEKDVTKLESFTTKEKTDKPIDETRTEIDKSIQFESRKKIFDTKKFIDDLFYNFIDQNHVYKRAVKQSEKYGVDYAKEISPYENFQLLNGVRGAIETFVEKGAMDFKTGNVIGPSLKKIFTDNKINTVDLYRDFIRYSISKRAIEKSSQGFETGVNIKAAKKFIKENPQFEKPFREIVKVSELSLKYLYDSGVLSKEVYEAALKANKDFVPFFRDFLDDAGKGNFTKNVRNPLKYFKGSKRKIVDPFESMYNNISTFITIAKRNEANISFIEMIEKVRKVEPTAFPEVQLSVKRTKQTKITSKELESIVDNPASLKPEVVEGFSVFRKESGILKDTEIVIYRNGKREVWEVGESFARPTKVFDKNTFEMIANAISLPSRTLRAGATGAAEFMYNNTSRDAFSSAILSEGWSLPYFQTIMGAGMMIKPIRNKVGLDPMWEKYVKSGALQNSLVTFDRTYFNKSMKEYFTKTNPLNVIRNLPEFFRIYIEFSEGLNRSGNFVLALKRNLKKGLREEVALKKAARETRDNPIDYRRMGAKIFAINQISAFFNARIQGLNQMIKAFKDRPLQTYAKTFMFVQLPSILLWMANHDDPDYQSLPQWRKDLFWHIKIEGTYYPIPKPFEIGLIFGTGTERFLDYYYGEDPKAIEKFKDAIAVQTFKGLIPIPDIIKPFFEAWQNRSFFFDRPIIPGGLENVPSEYQYTDFTSETMKLIAGLMRKINGDDFSKWSSPLVLENAWRGWTGGIGGYILLLSDSLLDAAGIIDRSKNRKKRLAEYPIIKAIIIKNPDRNAEPITDFRDLYEPVMKRINAARILANRGETEKALEEQAKLPENWVVLEQAYRALQVQEDIIRNINEGDLLPEEKLRQIDIMLKGMINGAKHAINLYYKKEVYIIKKEID